MNPKFVELTNKDGKKFFVNLSLVRFIHYSESRENTVLTFAVDHAIPVVENMEAIKRITVNNL
jgi:hypothetical protein